jgi:predicted transcriptional regulator
MAGKLQVGKVKALVRVIAKHPYPMNIGEIATRSNISVETARRYIQMLINQGVLVKRERKFWVVKSGM